jgi:carboxypeptidase C (cathepsin A)
LNKKGELEKNVNTWNKDFNLLFVDLVVGVGYSEHASNADIPQNSK